MSAILRYYLWNIGCQMNQADARHVAEELDSRGYRATPTPERADLLILNTCVVRQSAEDRVLGRLSSLRPLKAGPRQRALAVMGCFVGDIEALQRDYPYVDAFFRPSDLDGLAAWLDRWEVEHLWGLAGGEVSTAPQVAELVPVSYGCDHRCTYCIVALRRGAQHSRPIDEVVADVQALVARGAREVTLLGQNVDAYGLDLADGTDLAAVLRAVHAIEGLARIRFLTSHPREMTQALIDTVAALPRVCPSWELAVQSGDDEVLRRMGRGYTVERFRDLVQRIRAATPDGSINTDIIVGFPGESEAQFENTLRLVRETRFDLVHIAAYSPRPGTVAATWPDDVSPDVKERRRLKLEMLQEQIAGEINAQLLGQTIEVLVDGQQRGRWRGRTRTNKLVFFEADEDWLGRMALVRLEWTGPWSMRGQVVGAVPSMP
jgi:tRNA-2-methylthio-N6-dimethylallyladenosine synthase